MIRARTSLLAALAPAALALSACGEPASTERDLESLDRELAQAPANARDPALTASLADQILVDPALTQGSNADAIRPPNRPDPGATPPVDIAAIPDRVDTATLRRAPAPSGDCPECRAATGALTLGALAGSRPQTANCAAEVQYSAAWATRLPADLPLYPDARVIEAAGANRNGCSLRVVTFATAAPIAKVIDWYYTRAAAAGYSAGHRTEGAQHVLAGTRGRAAYIVYASPRSGGGTEIDLVVNAGG